MSIADALSSRYLTFHALLDAGVTAGNACLVVDLIHGREVDTPDTDDIVGDPIEWMPAPEPYEPTDDDLADYREWSREVEDRLLEARMQSDYDDATEAATMLTDADLRAAGLSVG